MYETTRRLILPLAAALAFAGCSRNATDAAAATPATNTNEIATCRVTHAAFTTFDATAGGCLNETNGINCNQYASKDAVYMSGGPLANALTPDQVYFFAVIAPGAQNGGFADGEDGNLSDAVAHDTPDDGSGKAVDPARRFRVTATGDVVSLDSTVVTVAAPDGKQILPLGPFDDTPNKGGVYVLAVCKDGATDPCGCKYDVFKIGGETPPSEVTVGKYYDRNASGAWDEGEEPIPGWLIDYEDGVSGTFPPTGADGKSSLFLPPDTYRFAEEQATNCPVKLDGMSIPIWVQTGPKPDPVYTDVVIGDVPEPKVTIQCGDACPPPPPPDQPPFVFGNVCLGKGGGHTLGFWSNKNGQSLFDAKGGLAIVDGLNLRDGAGNMFHPASYSQFRTWLLGAKATNMAYMLSAQLAAMKLNATIGMVSGDALVYAPGLDPKITTVADLISAADASLGEHGLTLAGSEFRAGQEALKNALDAGNNDLTFVQPTLATCPTATFEPQICQ